MNYKIKAIPYFSKEAKKLAKKYSSFKADLSNFIAKLSENPRQGTSLGNDCYKIRMSIKSKGKGKSGGARVITHIIAVKKNIYLLSIYSKGEKDNISNKEINELIKAIKT